MSQGTEGASAPSTTQPMQHGQRPSASAQEPASLVPVGGWHFLHLFYRIDRGKLAQLSEEARRQGRAELL